MYKIQLTCQMSTTSLNLEEGLRSNQLRIRKRSTKNGIFEDFQGVQGAEKLKTKNTRIYLV